MQKLEVGHKTAWFLVFILLLYVNCFLSLGITRVGKILLRVDQICELISNDYALHKSIDDMKKEIWDVYANSLTKTDSIIREAFEKDIDENNTESFVERLKAAIDNQIDLYCNEIEMKIIEHNNKVTSMIKEIGNLKLMAYGITTRMKQLKEWRDIRHSA